MSCNCLSTPPVINCGEGLSTEKTVLGFIPDLPKNDRRFLKGLLKQYQIYEVYKLADEYSSDNTIIRENFFTIVYGYDVYGVIGIVRKVRFEYKLKNLILW